jgi:hypothetical protein
MAATVPYPVRVEGEFEQPSRWLWLVKWLLLVPHFIVLALLWVAFGLLALISFVALLFGGRYPRGIFEFNVGVLRWTWRVMFYAFGANGTDRYPPFTLSEVPDYPARFSVEYPAGQRHGFRLIGWWLAGIPQYIVAGVFAGGVLGWGGRSLPWGGVIGLLVCVSLIVLLFRGAYPRSIFDFVLGLDRWVLRVAAYAAVMTPEYPPFRVDPGEHEPGGEQLVLPGAETPAVAPVAASRRWGFGRVLAVIAGTMVLLVGLGALAGAIAALVFDQTQRDAGGYLTTGTRTFATGTYALTSQPVRTHGWSGILGTVRIRVSSAAPVFVGIGPRGDVDRYLTGVGRAVATTGDAGARDFRTVPGGAPATRPGAQDFWVAATSGAGTRTLTWPATGGSWRLVVMNSDGGSGVRAGLALGATVPDLGWISVGLFAGATILLLVGGIVLYAALRRAA